MTPWEEIIEPIVTKLEVAAAFKMQAVFTPEGADALARIIKHMAALIDTEIERRTKQPSVV